MGYTETRTRQTEEEDLGPVSPENPLATKDVKEQLSVETSIHTADGQVTLQPAVVYWITVSNAHATASSAIELNDSDDDGGTDRWGITLEAVDIIGLPFHAVFDPPIRFNKAITIDITNGTVQATVGFRNR